MLVTVDSFDTPRERWHTDPVFRARVLAEWDKIEPYKAKGFIGGVAGRPRRYGRHHAAARMPHGAKPRHHGIDRGCVALPSGQGCGARAVA